MPLGDNGMLNATVVLLRAAESEDDSRTLSHLGELQVEWFLEAMARNGVSGFDRVFFAAEEADSWLTATQAAEKMRCPSPTFLKELAVPSAGTRGAEICEIIRRFPDSPISVYAGEPSYTGLCSHSGRVLRELRKYLTPSTPQRILICSRHGQILSNLGLSWVSEMIYAGFALRSHLAIPQDRADFCYGAMEFALKNADSLMFRFDASHPTRFAVTPIQYVACASSASPAC